MTDPLTIPALKVPQWLDDWDEIEFDADVHRKKPDPHFFQFSMPARLLKSYTGVHRRQAISGMQRSDELSTQRGHDPARSREIRDFVRFGFPWSTLSERQRQDDEPGLRKPGWLPTAILVNIMDTGEKRGDLEVLPDDTVEVVEGDGKRAEVVLPSDNEEWEPGRGGLPPFEVIDGQHRLWAFEEGEWPEGYELPVVAFRGLDRSWQAYLFWAINIKPKKINASLAYDLYPLLRSESWLERFSGPFVYRESRAQELVEALWAHPASPFKDRINMLGARGNPYVSQAAWIRSLAATFVKGFDGYGDRVGGLFGARGNEQEIELGLTRAQQAAFLIYAWRALHSALSKKGLDWVASLNRNDDESPMFAAGSLLNTDQGVRGYLSVLNDLTYEMAEKIEIVDWKLEVTERPLVEETTDALESLQGEGEIVEWLNDFGSELAYFDWRTSRVEDLSPRQRDLKMSFRGAGGYRQIKKHLLLFLSDAEGVLGEIAVRQVEVQFPEELDA